MARALSRIYPPSPGLEKQGIAAGIYTQTTDVEGEINGLITYDRRVRKMEPEVLREIGKALLE